MVLFLLQILLVATFSTFRDSLQYLKDFNACYSTDFYMKIIQEMNYVNKGFIYTYLSDKLQSQHSWRLSSETIKSPS